MSVVQILDRLIETVPEGAVLSSVEIGELCLFELKKEMRQRNQTAYAAADIDGTEKPLTYRGIDLEVFTGTGQSSRLNPVYVPDCALTGTDKEWRG